MTSERPYLRLSMRHLHLEELTAYDYRHIQTPRHFNLGECGWTLNTSNLRWPRGVTYAEMMQARSDVISGLTTRGR